MSLMATTMDFTAAVHQTNTLPRRRNDRTFKETRANTDLSQSCQLSTVNRHLGRQNTAHIRLIWAGFLILLSNTLIHPLTAGHIPNGDQRLNLELGSPEYAEIEGLKLQSRYYKPRNVFLQQRQKRDTENADWAFKDLNNGTFVAVDPNDELNCTPRAVEQFPGNFMPSGFATHGGVVFNILISIYMFFGLAIVCDSYFVPSLAQLRDALNISHDISGATFMAIGSSIPELFTSVISIIIAESDVGVGTITGSAIFNILFIMGCCSLAVSVNLVMSWWPVFRDCFAYMIAIFALVVVLLDDRIYWYEALALLLLYLSYLVLLTFNKTLEAKAQEVVNEVLNYYRDPPDEKQPLIDCQAVPSSSYRSRNAVEASTEVSNSKRSRNGKGSFVFMEQESTANMDEYEPNSDADEVNYESPMSFPSTTTRKAFWFLMFPLKLVFYLTIPDSRRPSCHRFCACTFFLSIVWIGILSYIMVWMATVAGDDLDIPDTVIGFTILATGTSIPDCLASYFVAKDGHADMAFANSVGSNIFDILVCLGLPWIIKASMNIEDGVPVHSHGLTYSVLILLITMFIFFASLMASDWTLNRVHGYFFLCLYVGIIVIVCLYEMNYFGPLNLPLCPRKDS